MMRDLHRNVVAAMACAVVFGFMTTGALGEPLLLTNDIAGCPLLEGNDTVDCNGKLELRSDEMGSFLDGPGFTCAFDPYGMTYDYFNPGPDPITLIDPVRERPSFLTFTILHINPDPEGDAHGGKIGLSQTQCIDTHYNRCTAAVCRGGPTQFTATVTQDNTYINEPTSMDSRWARCWRETTPWIATASWN